MHGDYGEYQERIDEISGLLGAPATLEDRAFRLIAFCAHESDERALDPIRTRSILTRHSTDEVRAWFEGFGIARADAPVRIPADPAAGIRGRLCLPVRHRRVTYGYVWLLDDEVALPPQELDPALRAAMAVADRIGSLLAAEHEAATGLGRELLRLLSGGREERAAARRALREALGPAAEGPFALCCLHPWQAGGDDGGEMLPDPRGIPGAVALSAMPSGDLAVLVRLRSAGAARAAGARLAEAAARGAAAGISDPRQGLADARGAWHEAQSAARAARAEPRLGPVAGWSSIGPYRLLTALPAGTDRAVAPLLDRAHAELAHTAEVFLDRAGQAGRTAAELSVHRQTLYYRLGRIEEITGLDLDRGEDRLLLHMALKAARLAADGGRRPAG